MLAVMQSTSTLREVMTKEGCCRQRTFDFRSCFGDGLFEMLSPLTLID